MRSGRKKKSSPEWVREVEDIKSERRVMNVKNSIALAKMNEKPQRRVFPHLRTLLNSNMNANARTMGTGSSEMFGGPEASVSTDSSSLSALLMKQHYDWHMVRAYCSAFETACSSGAPTLPKSQFKCFPSCAAPDSPLSLTGTARVTLSALELSCLDSISSHFDLFDPADISLVLSLLPPQHCSVLSAMCCRKNQLTDANLGAFAQEHVTDLFVGGTRLSDHCLETLIPVVDQRQSDQLKQAPSPSDVPESWEDVSERGTEELDPAVKGCRCLKKLVLLSPRISTEGLSRLLTCPLLSLDVISVHGKCASAVSANCAQVRVEVVVKTESGKKEETAAGEEGELAPWRIICRSSGTGGVVSSTGVENMAEGEVLTCAVADLKQSLGWS